LEGQQEAEANRESTRPRTAPLPSRSLLDGRIAESDRLGASRATRSDVPPTSRTRGLAEDYLGGHRCGGVKDAGLWIARAWVLRRLRDSNSALAASASANGVLLSTTRFPLLAGSGGRQRERFFGSPVAWESAGADSFVGVGAPTRLGLGERRMATAAVYWFCRRLGVRYANSFVDVGLLTTSSQNSDPEKRDAAQGPSFGTGGRS
jgi:hypothetical protein